MESASRARADRRLWIAVLALALAFGFLGSRGIWDPDEGRYSNVALNMLDSGDWITPRRNPGVEHWTKPPLSYWAIAAGVAVFGRDPWGARLPMALSYLLCALLTWRIARRIAPGSEDAAALAYATMLLCVGAAQYVSTDYVLAATEALALWGFVEARFGARRRAWITLMWAGFALGFMTKGPPALLPLLAVAAYDGLVRDPGRVRAFDAVGLGVFALLALPWFALVSARNPGLLGYFIDGEVVDRVAGDDFDRHGEWYGWLVVYGPTLLLGTLPWTPALVRWARALPATVRRWRDPDARGTERAWLLATLWLLLPLLVFCIARSRMPLYLLPLAAPLALLVAMQRAREARTGPRTRMPGNGRIRCARERARRSGRWHSWTTWRATGCGSTWARTSNGSRPIRSLRAAATRRPGSTPTWRMRWRRSRPVRSGSPSARCGPDYGRASPPMASARRPWGAITASA